MKDALGTKKRSGKPKPYREEGLQEIAGSVSEDTRDDVHEKFQPVRDKLDARHDAALDAVRAQLEDDSKDE
jgi:hypothetical protein